VPCIGDLTLRLPGLNGSRFRVSSDHTDEYNCVAWALRETDRWWSHVEILGHYRPPDVERAATIAAYQSMFASCGFEPCEDDELREGFEKIALFASGDEFTHVARQLPSGLWTSKLGQDCDIEHELQTLISIRSPMSSYRYGEVAAYMERPGFPPARE
jgi:hypothetical protein